LWPVILIKRGLPDLEAFVPGSGIIIHKKRMMHYRRRLDISQEAKIRKYISELYSYTLMSSLTSMPFAQAPLVHLNAAGNGKKFLPYLKNLATVIWKPALWESLDY
jgi:hypothetical protein